MNVVFYLLIPLPMYIKPGILRAGAAAVIIVLHAGCSQRQSPAEKGAASVPKTVKVDSFWNSVSFSDILDQIAVAYHIRICNPLHLEGVSITGTGVGHDSIEKVCRMITIVERGKVYLRYQDGVVYVSRMPLPSFLCRIGRSGRAGERLGAAVILSMWSLRIC